MDDWNSTIFTFPDGSQQRLLHGQWSGIWEAGGKQTGWHSNSEREVFIDADGVVRAFLETEDPSANSFEGTSQTIRGAHVSKEFVERMLKLEAFQ